MKYAANKIVQTKHDKKIIVCFKFLNHLCDKKAIKKKEIGTAQRNTLHQWLTAGLSVPKLNMLATNIVIAISQMTVTSSAIKTILFLGLTALAIEELKSFYDLCSVTR